LIVNATVFVDRGALRIERERTFRVESTIIDRFGAIVSSDADDVERGVGDWARGSFERIRIAVPRYHGT
jgi:hypothetical protein